MAHVLSEASGLGGRERSRINLHREHGPAIIRSRNARRFSASPETQAGTTPMKRPPGSRPAGSITRALVASGESDRAGAPFDAFPLPRVAGELRLDVVPVLGASRTMSNSGLGGAHQTIGVDPGRAIGQNFAIQLQPAGLVPDPFFAMQKVVFHDRGKPEGVPHRACGVLAGEYGVPCAVETVVLIGGDGDGGGGRAKGKRDEPPQARRNRMTWPIENAHDAFLRRPTAVRLTP